MVDTCPQLISLSIDIVSLHDEDDENDDESDDESDEDYDGIIRSITLDLPSLEKLYLENARTVKKCMLTCPKLVDIEIKRCPRMVTLKFDGGAQLHRLESESRLSSSCLAGHKKQVIRCVFICVCMYIIYCRVSIYQ